MIWSKKTNQNGLHKYYRLVELERHKNILPFSVGRMVRVCDVFSGTWVYDAAAGPEYTEEDCPFIPPKLMFRANGRPDDDYLRWRWQPHGCHLPSSNASFMLEMLRGKRMMFVGDHLHRSQLASLLCLLHHAVPDEFKSLRTRTDIPKTTFRAANYNTTIEFYYSPLLLESNREHAPRHQVLSEIIVREGSIDEHARHWKGADVLVLNSYTWWLTGNKIKILKGSFEDEKKDIRTMASEEAYRMALKEMARWVEKNMDPQKTRVFFTSLSPSHEMSLEWAGAARGNCYYEMAPILGIPNYLRTSFMQVVKQVLGESRAPGSCLAQHCSALRVPQGRACVNLQGVVEEFDGGGAGGPSEPCRLPELVPARRAGHLE